MCEMRCLIFYQPLDRVLEGVRFLLELQLVKGGDAFLYIVIIQRQQIGNGNVTVFIPVSYTHLDVYKRQHGYRLMKRQYQALQEYMEK